MEAELRHATRNPGMTLGRHFDLIGGTSVGSIIATMLALDWPMERVSDTFMQWCPEIFRHWLPYNLRNVLGFGIIIPKFSASPLKKRLNQVLGDMRLDSPELKTKLAIVTKRLDTGSAWWVLSNNPQSQFWKHEAPDRRNHSLRVVDLIQASTAAPTVFRPKRMRLAPDRSDGLFVDGGVTPFNDPSLALIMLANLSGHGLRWPLGEDKLSMVSIGTGSWREPVVTGFTANLGVQVLKGMISDSQKLSLALMQWMSKPDRGWAIDGEINNLAGDLLAAGPEPLRPLLKFQRYDVLLEKDDVEPLLGWRPSQYHLDRMRRLDDPRQQNILYQIARKAAERQVKLNHFL